MCFFIHSINNIHCRPWTSRRSNQSIMKEIGSGCSLEGMMLKLKLQYFGHLMRRVTHWKRLWCWEGLEAGGEGDDRGWDVWMASPTRWTWVWVNSGSWWWTGKPGMLGFMGSQRVRHDWATELNWTIELITVMGIVAILKSLQLECDFKSITTIGAKVTNIAKTTWFLSTKMSFLGRGVKMAE